MANTNKLIDLSKLSRFWDKVREIIGDLTALTTTDKSSLVGAVNEIASYTPVYGNTASGAIATFDTSLALPLQDCTIAINAVQESGTPTPSSPKAISGFTGANITRCGGNIWDNEWETGTYNTLGNKSNWSGAIRSKNFIDIEPSKDYCALFGTTSQFMVFWYKADNSFIGYDTITESGDTVTSPATAYKATFSTWNDYGSTYNNDISINYPATTTAISWQDEAGTVYGGSLDVTSGVLTVTHKGLSINSSSNFVSFSVGTANANATFNLTDVAIETSGGASKKGAISSTGQENPLYWSADRKNETPDNGNMSFAINGNGTTVRFYITENFANISTIDDFKNAFTATTLVYPLATPQTYQLTPTQISAIVGTNNIFTDTNGNTSVVYACSLKDYIDSQ